MFQLLRKWQRRSQELPEDIIDYKHQCEQLVNKYETLLDQISQYMQTEERILGKEQAEVVVPPLQDTGIFELLTIKGELLQLKQTESGLSYGHIIGSPAKFKQKREVDGEWIEGEATRLDYDERDSMFFLSGNASLKRKKDGKIKDEVTGEKLSYSSITDVYRAETAPGKTRTRMTLMPRNTEN